MIVKHQTLVKDLSHLDQAEYQSIVLNKLNEDGWELVNIVGNFAYLKRINPQWLASQRADR